MRAQRWVGVVVWCSLVIVAAAWSAIAGDKLLVGTPSRVPVAKGDNHVVHRCLTPSINELLATSEQLGLRVERDKPWSLPTQALADGQQATIHVLVLRFHFQEEVTDDPNTTGRGRMNFANPLADPVDSARYYDTVGHWIDPPPHNTAYFDAHLKALNYYWSKVSEGHLNLTWEVFPPVPDSAYELPYPMRHYGRCDSVVIGLEDYFEDAIRLADTLHILDPNHPDIDFSQYQAIFLIHAGSDRQNDIGFPPTCSDLFTGFIKFGDSVRVDNGAKYIRTALMLPETSCQDNRATALNAVMAHEFGHQLGLVDLYRTDNFLSQLGDFSLMDNNGFGTGIDFGFDVGQVFGVIPIFPDAWSRAYLGYVPVVDFRQGSDIRVVAAEVVSSGIKIARVPISENEYYLIENRIQETDGLETNVLADSVSGVIQGPANNSRQLTGEYDNLMPGSGMLIYHVDEGVTVLDYDGDGVNNFEDNDLQQDPERKFVTLVEADGLVNFGGFYRAGYGSPADMFREDRNHSFTPNTNPPSIDNSGNNTHVFMTNITRDTARPGGGKLVYLDSVMLFDLETDKLAENFPVRVGSPLVPFSPIAADLNDDGTDELLVVSRNRLSAVASDGRNFLLEIADPCDSCPLYGDSAIASVHAGRPYVIPIYYRAGGNISANPVIGSLGEDPLVLTAVAWQSGANGAVRLVAPYDQDDNGLADEYGDLLPTSGVPIALSFGDVLWILTDSGVVYKQTQSFVAPSDTFRIDEPIFHGLCRVGANLVVAGGDDESTRLYYITDTLYSYSLGDYYNWGPVQADLDRDGLPEVVAATPDGDIVYVTVDTLAVQPTFRLLEQVETDFAFTANPIIGDVDGDNNPDVVIGGQGAVYAFDHHGVLKTDYPIQVDDRFPTDSIISAPIQAEIALGQMPELIFPTAIGNMYAFGPDKTYGFPLPAGELGIGSPVLFSDSTGAKLGYHGLDGWFYAWDVTSDEGKNYWPMAGRDPFGTFALPTAALGTPVHRAELFRDEEFYNYPNPITDGRTAFRYTLGESADKVTITVFDLTGQEIADMTGSTFEGDNELSWSCGDVTPGVYRCRITVEFSGDTKTAFTDVAIIR